VIVVDASVLTNAFTDDGPVGAAARAELAGDAHWAGPEHLLVESFCAVRGRWLGHKIGGERAVDALAAIASAAIEVVSVRPLIERMWELRDNVTGYDAAYLALAESFDCVLVSADARLARVPDVRCEIRIVLPPTGQLERS
jgi:predicted nucleic acid-binding protein